jgi:hypothetical protein
MQSRLQRLYRLLHASFGVTLWVPWLVILNLSIYVLITAASLPSTFNGTGIANSTDPKYSFAVTTDLNSSEHVVSTNWSSYEPWRKTDAQTGGTLLDQDTHQLRIGMRMGGPRQHVGTLRKQRLYDALYEGLKGACELGTTQDCTPRYASKSIEKHAIVYNAGKNKWASNAHLTLTANHAYFNQEFKGFQDAMVSRDFATTLTSCPRLTREFSTSRLLESTCKWPTRKKTATTLISPVPARQKMSNVNTYAAIAVPMNTNFTPVRAIEDLLHVSLLFNGEMTEGEVSCTADFGQKVHDFAQHEHRDLDVAKAMGLDINTFYDPDSSCGGNWPTWFEFMDDSCPQ